EGGMGDELPDMEEEGIVNEVIDERPWRARYAGLRQYWLFNGRLPQNSINAVERVVQYINGDMVPQEAPHGIEDHKSPVQWPEHGTMEFNNVKMAYRPGLPNVLRGISIKVRGEEKILYCWKVGRLLDPRVLIRIEGVRVLHEFGSNEPPLPLGIDLGGLWDLACGQNINKVGPNYAITPGRL
ncbi:hypothetical protein DFH29DRAFT_884280, partial [Suillus ampliporus]